MIEINKVRKKFEKTEAVKGVSFIIQPQNVFGMLGTNGAGKSTLLRMMAGVLKPDSGEIFIDGQNVWDNPEAKKKCFYISDDQYFSRMPLQMIWVDSTTSIIWDFRMENMRISLKDLVWMETEKYRLTQKV